MQTVNLKQLEVTPGDFLFWKSDRGNNMFGYVIEVNDDHVVYIRDSLTRWAGTPGIPPEASKIDEAKFISAVKRNAANSNEKPTDEQIKAALKLFIENPKIDYSDILKIFK